MIFKHQVKYNGVFYPAGANVPVGDKSVKDIVVEKEKVEEQTKNDALTKTDINRMSVSELKELAKNEKIEDFSDMNGSELKKSLIEHFGL